MTVIKDIVTDNYSKQIQLRVLVRFAKICYDHEKGGS